MSSTSSGSPFQRSSAPRYQPGSSSPAAAAADWAAAPFMASRLSTKVGSRSMIASEQLNAHRLVPVQDRLDLGRPLADRAGRDPQFTCNIPLRHWFLAEHPERVLQDELVGRSEVL